MKWSDDPYEIRISLNVGKLPISYKYLTICYEMIWLETKTFFTCNVGLPVSHVEESRRSKAL